MPFHTQKTHQTPNFHSIATMFNLNPQFPNNSRLRFNDDAHFRLDTMEEDSGVCSPPLWDRTNNNNNQISPPDSPVNVRALSPASRARAIAKGRQEMMEMVENMPETSYELSLKDLVEKRREFQDDDETQSMEEGEERSILSNGRTGSRKNININKKQSMRKNSSMNNNNKGLLINIFFPFSIGSKKKKRNNSLSGPKTEVMDKRDWWWKKFTGSGDSESLGITTSSGDSTGRSGSSGSSGSSVSGSLHSNSHRFRTKNKNDGGCWSFFPSRKKKS